jgi:hypothetical protein
MIGLYLRSQISLTNGTYKIYDISTNDAINLLIRENGWDLSDFTLEDYEHNTEIKMYIEKHKLNVITLKRTPAAIVRNLNKGEKAVLVKYTTIYTDIPYICRYNDIGVRTFTMPTFSVIERIE